MPKRKPPPTDQHASTHTAVAVRRRKSPDSAAILDAKTWIVQGQLPADIVDSIRQHYPKEDQQLILSAAIDDLEQDGREVNREAARGFLINAYREIYRRALEINDFSASLAALKAFDRQIPR